MSKRRAPKRNGDGFLSLLVLIVIGLAIMGRMNDDAPGWTEPTPEPTPGFQPEMWSEAQQGGSARFDQSAPDVPDQDNALAPRLPPVSRFDDQSRVEVDNDGGSSSGTAFAIGTSGLWLSAKHVARNCRRVGIVRSDGRGVVEANVVYLAENADVAILQTRGGPKALALDLDESDIKLNAKGFHIGYPQGKPGEVYSRLIGRELMVTEGAWRGKEQTLAWVETARTKGINGSLGGLSGGPVFDDKGDVVGITVAQSPRRGRIITTSATSVLDALTDASVSVEGQPYGALSINNLADSADRLRKDLRVVKVLCWGDR
jgi:serine protease Do